MRITLTNRIYNFADWGELELNVTRHIVSYMHNVSYILYDNEPYVTAHLVNGDQ